MQGFEHIQDHLVSDNEDYIASISEHRRGADQMLMGHIAFYRWTPSAFRRLLRDWPVFRACIPAPIFAAADVDNEKWARFVQHLGFQHLSIVECTDGQARRMFVSLPQEHHVPEDHQGRQSDDHDRTVVGPAALPPGRILAGPAALR